MSVLSDLFASIRKMLVVEHRIDALSAEVERLSAAHVETRERLIRLEVIIDEARRAGAARHSSQGQIEP